MEDPKPTARAVTSDLDGGGGGGDGDGGDVALDKIPLSATLGRLSSAEKDLRCDDDGNDDDDGNNDEGGPSGCESNPPPPDPAEPDLPDLVVNPNARRLTDPFRPLDYSGPATAEDAEPATAGDVYGLAVAASGEADEQQEQQQGSGDGTAGSGPGGGAAGGGGDADDLDDGGSSDFSSVQGGGSPMQHGDAADDLEDRSDASSALGFEPVPGKGIEGRDGIVGDSDEAMDDNEEDALEHNDNRASALNLQPGRDASKIEAMMEMQRHVAASSSPDEDDDDDGSEGDESPDEEMRPAYGSQAAFPSGGGRGGLSKFEVMKRKRVYIKVPSAEETSSEPGSKANKTEGGQLSAAEASKLDAMKRMRSVGKGVAAATAQGQAKATKAAESTPQPPPSVTITILGTAQDGGIPQPGCYKPCCESARDDQSLRRTPVALGIVGSDGSRHLIEASRCLGEQLDLWRGTGTYPTENGGTASAPAAVKRSPVDSVSITHAHLGHVDGLALFGREVISAEKLPVHCSASFRREGIAKNPVWNIMVEQGAIVPKEWSSSSVDGAPSETAYVPGTGVCGSLEDIRELTPKCGFVVRPIPVPHRAELSDTHALLLEGVPSGRRLLFLPDHDSWEQTLRAVGCETLREWLDKLDVDVALLDGTFFGDPEAELGGIRDDVVEIPHPPVSDTLSRLGKKQNVDKSRVLFCHLNHTNPLCDPASKETKLVEDAGWEVASEGDVFVL